MELNTEQLHMPTYNTEFLFLVHISGFDLVVANLLTIFFKTY